MVALLQEFRVMTLAQNDNNIFSDALWRAFHQLIDIPSGINDPFALQIFGKKRSVTLEIQPGRVLTSNNNASLMK